MFFFCSGDALLLLPAVPALPFSSAERSCSSSFPFFRSSSSLFFFFQFFPCSFVFSSASPSSVVLQISFFLLFFFLSGRRLIFQSDDLNRLLLQCLPQLPSSSAVLLLHLCLHTSEFCVRGKTYSTLSPRVSLSLKPLLGKLSQSYRVTGFGSGPGPGPPACVVGEECRSVLSRVGSVRVRSAGRERGRDRVTGRV